MPHHPLSHPVKALGWCVLPLQVQLFCYWVELSTEGFQSRGFVASHQVYKIFMKLLQVKFPVASSTRQKLFWVSEFRVDQHGCLPYSLCTGQTASPAICYFQPPVSGEVLENRKKLQRLGFISLIIWVLLKSRIKFLSSKEVREKWWDRKKCLLKVKLQYGTCKDFCCELEENPHRVTLVPAACQRDSVTKVLRWFPIPITQMWHRYVAGVARQVAETEAHKS